MRHLVIKSWCLISPSAFTPNYPHFWHESWHVVYKYDACSDLTFTLLSTVFLKLITEIDYFENIVLEFIVKLELRLSIWVCLICTQGHLINMLMLCYYFMWPNHNQSYHEQNNFEKLSNQVKTIFFSVFLKETRHKFEQPLSNNWLQGKKFCLKGWNYENNQAHSQQSFVLAFCQCIINTYRKRGQRRNEITVY